VVLTRRGGIAPENPDESGLIGGTDFSFIPCRAVGWKTSAKGRDSIPEF
jgi:hypothetical protein